MAGSIHWKRVETELKILTINPDVQSYFYYESSGNDKQSKQFCIYGYLLPHREPYKHGSYKVRIILTKEFPFRSPILELLTYIYHPAIENNISTPRFCKCSLAAWTVGVRISRWLEHYVNIIDRPDASPRMYCIRNEVAEKLYAEDKMKYEQKALTMVKKYSHPRPNRSIVSLKFAVKQIICKQLDFHSRKINQLPLSDSLITYLNASLYKT